VLAPTQGGAEGKNLGKKRVTSAGKDWAKLDQKRKKVRQVVISEDQVVEDPDVRSVTGSRIKGLREGHAAQG